MSHKKADSVVKRFEADARTLVPVSDEIGGTVIYIGGRPAYYVLNGEWFEAVRQPAMESESHPGPDDVVPDVCYQRFATGIESTS